MQPYVIEKRNELIWALATQGYTTRQIGFIFGISKSTAHNIMSKMPAGWVSPWIKNTSV